MLKIAEYNTITGEKIDLKELEKYGLKPKYDENTGLIKKLESYRYKGVLHQILFQTIFYKYKDDYILDDKCEYDNVHDYRVDTDLLYDLIKDGLVEKEKE